MSLLSGIALWTPIEYFVHRYVLHRLAPHYQHHDEPEALAYIFAVAVAFRRIRNRIKECQDKLLSRATNNVQPCQVTRLPVVM